MHLRADGLSLRDIYRDFLLNLPVRGPSDSMPFIGMLLQVARYLELGSRCQVYDLPHEQGERAHTVG